MGVGNDDFLIPAHAYWTTSCTSNSLIEWNRVILPTGASISLVCYFFLFIRYWVFKSPLLRRHPTSLAIYKAVFSCIYIQQYLWLPFVSNSIFYGNNNTCAASTFSAIFAFITQVSFIGSQFCFLSISIELRINYTNPFTSFKQNCIYYVMWIITMALITGVALIVMGPHVYGPSSQGTIWIQNRADHDASPAWPKIVLRYILIVVIYCYSLWANFQYFNNSQEATNSKTFSYRLSIMERSQKYTIGFIFYEIVIASIELISFCLGNAGKQTSFVYSLSSYINSLQGLWDLSVIMYCNWADIKNEYYQKTTERATIVQDVAQENLSLYPHLNTALRAEILYFVTRGISYCSKHEDTLSPLLKDLEFLTPFHEYERNIEHVLFNFNVEGDNTDTDSTGTQANWIVRMSNGIDQFNKEQDEVVFALQESELQKECQRLGFWEEVQGDSAWLFNNRSSEGSVVINPLGPQYTDRDSRLSSLSKSIPEEQNIRFFRQSSSIDRGIEIPQRNTISLQNIYAVGAAAVNHVFPPVYGSFRFKEICPSYFKEIRTMCGIKNDEFSDAFLSVAKTIFSEGRSGAFLFFSSHEKYIVKSTTESEMITLYRILPKYVKYLKENPSSFILRYLGAYNITMYGVKLSFLIMQNIFPPQAALSERYDLKGSWVKRGPTQKSGQTTQTQHSSSSLYLDNDWKQNFSLPIHTMQSLVQQVKEDACFLRDLKLMDYSLLIGVEPQQPGALSESTAVSAGNFADLDDGTRIYIGIIDILQEFNFSKWLERIFKVCFRCDDPLGISSMEPVAYAERFLRRCVMEKFQESETQIQIQLP